jgi:alkanesulfonate monooxygenase
MEAGLAQRGSDGFTVIFPYLPQGLDDVTLKLVPELQWRGLFRTDDERTTLCEHLGMSRPANRFFA